MTPIQVADEFKKIFSRKNDAIVCAALLYKECKNINRSLQEIDQYCSNEEYWKQVLDEVNKLKEW